MTLGDTFHGGRYTIKHKLGYGGYSTVWLAKDNSANRWTSLKIKQARVSPSILEDDKEVKALRLLEQKHNSRHDVSASRCFAQLLDCFQHHGPNGLHTCIVTEFLGPSVSQKVNAYNERETPETFRPDTILRVSKQLLEAIHTVHESGIVHGDVSPGNVIFTCRTLLEDGDEYLIESLGGEHLIAEYTGTSPRPANLPEFLMDIATYNKWFDCPEEDIRLVDWGESFPIDQTQTGIAQPPDLNSPETFFVGHFDYAHDLWRVGCVIHYLFYQKDPFGFAFSNEDAIERQVRVLGPLPPEWHAKWVQMINNNPDYEPLSEGALCPLSDSFESRRLTIISNTEANDGVEKRECTKHDYEALVCFSDVMRGLMQHDPKKRSSALEALAQIEWEDEWEDSADSAGSVDSGEEESDAVDSCREDSL